MNKSFICIIKERKPTRYMESTKLKDVIRNEIDNVSKMLITSKDTDKIIFTKWLQSLQRINDICKERNRY